MANKTYGQLCPMARALDVLGDRWTLLLIRELLLGPKRFKELLAMLPAMGTNRLSERLSMLVSSGVIRPTSLPAQAAAPAYELTEQGEQLREPMVGFGLWGLSLPEDERIDPATARAELIALCLAGTCEPTKSAGVHQVVEFQVGAESFHIVINDGRALPRSGASAAPPSVHAQCDIGTFTALATRQITPLRALRERRAILLRGSQQAFVDVFMMLGLKN
jgi:DNA-binding HxlR family transcriptional regulator